MVYGIAGLRRLSKLLTSAVLVLTAVMLTVGAALAQDDEASVGVFRDHISRPLVQSRCVNCHVQGGLSGHTRLVFVRSAGAPDHETLNLETFAEFLDMAEAGQELILSKIQGAGHGGGEQAPVGTDDFDNMDLFLSLLEGRPQGFVTRLLEGLDDAESSLLFGITTPADGDVLAGNAVAVSATGAPTGAVHFAYRPTGDPESVFTYLGAAANRDAALFVWDTTALTDTDYELAALFTEDEGETVTFDAFGVSIDNVSPATLPDIVEVRGRKTQALGMDTAYEVITVDGVVVTILTGALDSDDRITISAADPPAAETAPGDAIGSGIDIALDSGRDAFAEAVSLAVPYYEGKPDGIVHGTDIPEDGLSLWFLDPQTDTWALIPGSVVQPGADRVVADVVQTGQFGIFNAPLLRVERDGEPVTSLDFGPETTLLTVTVANGNATSESLTWTIDLPGESWLSVAPHGGNTGSDASAVVTVSVDRAGLEAGAYTGTLQVRSNGGVREVGVLMRVPASPGGGGGCAALLAPPSGPSDPTLMGLLALVTVYLVFGRRRLWHGAVMG